MEAKLAIIDSNGEISSLVLGKRRIALGRDVSCHVLIQDSRVSRHHAEIVPEDGEHVLRDKGSTNGTVLNGQSVRMARLRHGDRIELGGTLIVFLLTDSSSNAGHGGPQHGTTILSLEELLAGDPSGPAQGLRATPVAGEESLDRIRGHSAAIRRVKEDIRKAAGGDESVLILGETGTGKELAAQALHCMSRRRRHPFVAVALPALDENLVSSELFGHTRGAFTGASESRKGWFEIADRGTLFLDEIAHMPLRVQVKLLRVLEEHSVVPVGGTAPISIDVRVISASDLGIVDLIQKQGFSSALYYRLSTIEIRLPPLRERMGDVPELVAHFWEQASGSSVGGESFFDRRFIDGLQQYQWPGNIRELRNAVFHAHRMADGRPPGPQHLPARVLASSVHCPPDRSVRGLVDQHVLSVLEDVGWNRSEAARLLGITRQGLGKRLKRMGIGVSKRKPC